MKYECDCMLMKFEVSEVTEVMTVKGRKKVQFRVLAKCKNCGEKKVVSTVEMNDYERAQIIGMREAMLDWYK